MQRLFVLSLALVALAVGGGIARADVAPDPEYGQTLSPGERTSVAMTGETVTVTLEKKGARVHAVFFLKNTGASEALEVGFPDVARASSHGSDEPPGGLFGYKLRGFEATVDGSPVKHTYKWVKNRQSPRERAAIEARLRALEAKRKKTRDAKARRRLERDMRFEKERLDDWAWYGWLVWDMRFAAGEEKRVEVSYTVPYRPPYRATHLREAHFEYVLQTGALWKGPIGRAVIEVRFGEGMERKNVAAVAPAGYTDGEAGISWDLRDIEPEEDVRIRLNRYADYETASREYLARYEEALREGKRGTAVVHLAWAAESQEKGGLWEACLASCRKIVALEKEAREKGGGGAYAIAWWKGPYVPWECKIAECLRQLGKRKEAREAAAEALTACRDLLENPPSALRYGLNKDILAKRIEDLEAFLAEEES